MKLNSIFKLCLIISVIIIFFGCNRHDRPELAKIHSEVGNVLYNQGNYAEAKKDTTLLFGIIQKIQFLIYTEAYQIFT